MRTIETDLLIVGGGIAGSALACALRRSGYRIVLVEQRRDTLDSARGDHLQPCNVEAIAKWGALDEFLRRGGQRRVGHEFRTPSGEALLSMNYASEGPLPFPFFLVFPHDQIAELFLELAAENPQFTRLQPVNARKFEVSADGVAALRATLPTGEDATIKPHIVVGADGTNSAVRQALGFAADEHAYNYPLVAMFGPRPLALKPDDYFFRYGSEHGMLVVQQRTDGQIKVTTLVGDEGIAWWKASTQAQRAEVLAKRAHILAEFDSSIAGFYPTKLVHAHEYAKGNVVLVGDAAHSIHPSRGQGLNVGIASLPALIERLPAPGRIADAALVRERLRDYAVYQRARYEKIFARNHDAALAMEATIGAGAAEFVRQEDAMIRRIHAEPELRRMHWLEVTGYPFGFAS